MHFTSLLRNISPVMGKKHDKFHQERMRTFALPFCNLLQKTAEKVVSYDKKYVLIIGKTSKNNE